MKLTRRTFVKNIGVIAAGVMTYSPVTFSKPTDLNDLYDFIESKTIVDPIKGEIPFKLYPFQKEILTQIHNNDRVIFIKSRQIGMSYLTAAYSAWAKTRNKNGVNIYGAFPSFANRCFWDEKYCRFTGDPLYQYGSRGDLDTYWPYPERFNIVTLDELNWDSGKYTSPAIWSSRKTREARMEDYTDFQLYLYQLEEEMRIGYVHDVPSSGKIIVCGTPDPYGNLKSAIHSSKLNEFRVFCYPATYCTPLWDNKRISTVISSGVRPEELVV